MLEIKLKPGQSEHESWQFRAVKHTLGNGTQLGCVLVSVLGGAMPHHAPQYFGGATITAAGMVLCDFRDREGYWHLQRLICPVAKLVTAFRKLADDLKLDDTDREDLFRCVRQWIKEDKRNLTEEDVI